MIPRIICFLFGHVFKQKVYTGQTYEGSNMLGSRFLVSLYRWEYLKRCARCGRLLGKEGE